VLFIEISQKLAIGKKTNPIFFEKLGLRSKSVRVFIFFVRTSFDSNTNQMSVYGDEDGPTSIVPRVQNLSELRACRICGLVKSLDQFVQDGCDNCEYRDRQAVEYTTNQFKGYDRDLVATSFSFLLCVQSVYYLAWLIPSTLSRLIAMMNPEQSWIHKWQRMKRTE